VLADQLSGDRTLIPVGVVFVTEDARFDQMQVGQFQRR
jgi:hypothetical protein